MIVKPRQCNAWCNGNRVTDASDLQLEAQWLPELGIQFGHLKPTYAPPATLPETLKPNRIGYPLSNAQILQLLTTFLMARCMNADGSLFSFALSMARPEDLCSPASRTVQMGQRCGRFIRKLMGGSKGAKTEPRRLHPLLLVMQIAPPLMESAGSSSSWGEIAAVQPRG